MVGVSFIQSCADESLVEQPPLPTPRADLEARGGFQDDGTLFIYATEEEEQRDSLTILGRLRNNPFTVKNMSNAYRALWDPNAPDLNVTHRYIEFTPATWRELGEVVDSFDVFDFDVRHEVIQIGQYYPQPGTAPDDLEIPRRWAILDASAPIPTGFSHSILAELFVPDPQERTMTKKAFDQVGEPYGVDGGGDDPDSTPPGGCLTCCQNYPNCNLHCDPDPNFFGCSECCENYPLCIRIPALVCTGPPDPPEPNMLPCGCSQPNNYKTVAGCIQVEDDDFLGRVPVVPPGGAATIEVAPVRGIQVKVWGDFFWVSTVYTNDQGCFRTPHAFGRKFPVHIWTKWKNRHVTVNGWTSGTGSVIRIGVDRYVGNWPVRVLSNLNRMHIVMPNVGNARSLSQVWYRSSHYLNGVRRALDFSADQGVPGPPGRLRVTISNFADGSGAAPMLASSGTGAGVIFSSCMKANVLLGGTAVNTNPTTCAIFSAAHQLLPDVWQNYGARCPEFSGSRTTGVFMHELGHTIHWRDTPIPNWNANIHRTIDIGIGGILQPTNPIYEVPFGNGTTIPGFGWTASIESWAEYYGSKVHGELYDDRFYEGNAFFNGLEGFIPSAVGVPGAAWIPEGIGQDLEDADNPAWEGMRASPISPQNDNVEGLSMSSYYGALISAGNMPTPTMVRNRITSTFLPAGQTIAGYNTAYATYG